MSQAQPLIALLGGTFNPIHHGHVKSAAELLQVLQADEVRLVPCHRPPHRNQPDVSSQQRLAMAKLAVAEHPGLRVDDRELRRDQLSYTVDTLQHIREECGDQVILCWVMGTDAFANINQWHRWRDILALAHIVVMARPGETLPQSGEVAQWLQQHQIANIAQLKQSPAGGILLQQLTPYPISATAIREAVKAGLPIAEQVPATVLDFIEQHQLYRGD